MLRALKDSFTSTGSKFFYHQEAMRLLRDGIGTPITTHVMLTDICNHTCAFCSVQAREGDTLDFEVVMKYLDILQEFGLKSVILSGGGNPILYKCRKSGRNFNDVVDAIHKRGLEIGLITNGMPLKLYEDSVRESWVTVRPETLDKLTWVRISMSGFDHPEGEVMVPDIDSSKTTLGFSYVAHDIYLEPSDPHHGKVSTPRDVISGDRNRAPDLPFELRIDSLVEKFIFYCDVYSPSYLRLLPNCLEPQLIPRRCKDLEAMAWRINNGMTVEKKEVAFVQYKPPSAPRACYLGYVHPVLNCDGYVYPCDSCVLNEAANHQFANPWRVCRWDDVDRLYCRPIRSLIKDPAQTCPGCVFPQSNEILTQVVEGSDLPFTADLITPRQEPTHVNFI